ncbi:tetratricopeptide repeat protein [Rhodohalobacter sp. 614A]|uniref:tetratricopeptide repeat protein n=1 Tax=Rhodohalobacter sp. 614A TaxID=2908649 RepID=UPI001F488786|nr:tetratricopeptide repeat protein [Rhodohalobacter sp. 614A]
MNRQTAGFTKREGRLYAKGTLRFCFVIGLFCVCISQPILGQTKVLIEDAFFEIDAREAIDSLYNRNTDVARSELKPWRDEYPEHPLWMLWDGMELWWNVLEDLNDHSHDREFMSRMQRADYEAGKILRSEPGHPDALIIRAVANGYIARLHANREEWVTSVQVGRRAYQAHQELMEVSPDLPDNHFAEGMKLYYAAYIPDAYPVVKAVSWFFPEGDRTEGLETLEYAARNAVFARPEANYFLASILLNYEKDFEKAKQKFTYLLEKYPNNGYYRRQYLRTLSQLGQYDEILTFAQSTLDYWSAGNLQDDPGIELEVSYWIGRAYYHFGDWSSALPFLERSVQAGKKLVNSEERDIYAMAAYFAGRALENLDQKKEAKKYYEIAADQKAVPEARNRSRDQLKNL